MSATTACGSAAPCANALRRGFDARGRGRRAARSRCATTCRAGRECPSGGASRRAPERRRGAEQACRTSGIVDRERHACETLEREGRAARLVGCAGELQRAGVPCARLVEVARGARQRIREWRGSARRLRDRRPQARCRVLLARGLPPSTSSASHSTTARATRDSAIPGLKPASRAAVNGCWSTARARSTSPLATRASPRSVMRTLAKPESPRPRARSNARSIARDARGVVASESGEASRVAERERSNARRRRSRRGARCSPGRLLRRRRSGPRRTPGGRHERVHCADPRRGLGGGEQLLGVGEQLGGPSVIAGASSTSTASASLDAGELRERPGLAEAPRSAARTSASISSSSERLAGTGFVAMAPTRRARPTARTRARAVNAVHAMTDASVTLSHRSRAAAREREPLRALESRGR